jgi:hypothetical protein
MAHPTIPVSCPHCGRGPGICAVLTVVMQSLRAMAFDQVLTGWRWLALCTAVAGLLVVQPRQCAWPGRFPVSATIN